ncbi:MULTISPECIES: hypothetical protein [Streptomyces]|uniref:hypothetical protein n=1 Tax=Streptomyces TaxID=1883 RepID=UPI00292D48F9|nr:hypothetical protein [Streptomyces sp. NEAU-HV9]
MERRRLLAAVAVLPTLSVLPACTSGDSDTSRPPSSGRSSSDGARRAVEAYVDALNKRSADALIAVGGVPDEQWSRHEAAQILDGKGGRGWTIKNVRIEYDISPDVGSARLEATDRGGTTMRDTFTVMREKGDWHLVVFAGAPAATDKPTSSTEKPA